MCVCVCVCVCVLGILGAVILGADAAAELVVEVELLTCSSCTTGREIRPKIPQIKHKNLKTKCSQSVFKPECFKIRGIFKKMCVFWVLFFVCWFASHLNVIEAFPRPAGFPVGVVTAIRKCCRNTLTVNSQELNVSHEERLFTAVVI